MDGQGGEAAVDASLQGQRTDRGVERSEGPQAIEVDVARVVVEKPAQRRRGGVVEAPRALPDGLLAHQLHHRLEAVGEGTQVVAVEGIEPGLLAGGIEPVVADQAGDQGPVLLLDMAVVVLMRPLMIMPAS